MTPDQLAALHATGFDRPWSPQAFQTLLEQPSTLLVAGDSSFALAQIVLDDAELLTIVVDPANRGVGHGKRLLSHLLAQLQERGVTRLFLDVAEDNLPARALYQQFGFLEDGRRRSYYPRQAGAVDALLLSLAI